MEEGVGARINALNLRNSVETFVLGRVHDHYALESP